jgi:beta-N-acetylhexosaminidase
MEGSAAERRERRRSAQRKALRRRRVAAVLVTIAATAGVWFVFLRSGDDGARGAQESHGAGVSEPIAHLVREMTPAERVDQVLLLGFDGVDSSSPAITELRSHQLGGILVGPANWVSRDQGASLVGALRSAGLAGDRISPLIVATQEGGPDRSYPDLPPAEREIDVGDSGSVPQAEAWARETATALRSVGFDLDIFPVADVATLDSPLADRAFSDDASTAAAMTAASIRGCRDARFACAPLHFPGLGAASQDTDEGPATVSLDATSLTDRDLAVFRAAFDEHARAVELSLAFYAAYDAVTPAATSPEIANGLLRDDLVFKGVAITDDLGAGAVKATSTVPEAAVAAIQAGADLVRIDSPDQQDAARAALRRAAKSGGIPAERLDEAAGRVLELKRSLGLLRL